jgi:DNA polymerase elongation subunit (family B)
MKFNVLDWSPYHEEDEDGNKSYAVRVFGKTSQEDGAKTVFLRVDGFQPFFYVQLPDSWRRRHADELISTVKDRLGNWQKAKDGMIDSKIVKSRRFRGFTNKKMFNFLQLKFSNMQAFRAWEKILRNKINVGGIASKMQPHDKMFPLYESNIEPLLRLIHLRKMSAAGWIEFDETRARPTEESINDLNYQIHWESLRANKTMDMQVAPFKIACYDIECTSEDGNFPQAARDGDKITMIGMTYSYYGQDECYKKWIGVLGSCDPIPGAIVEECKTEGKVLTAWKRELNRENPDIVTTYNGFGFDDKYTFDRHEKCDIPTFMTNLGRVKGYTSELKEKKLSSSALGDNVMHYLDMVGRIQIDLLKVVQRDHKLEGYTLDYVVGYFIKEKITKIESIKKPPKHNGIRCNLRIQTKSAKGLSPGDFAAISYNDGISVNPLGVNGVKYPIVAIEPITLKKIVKEKVKDKDGKDVKDKDGKDVMHEVEKPYEEYILWSTISDDLAVELDEILTSADDEGEKRNLDWTWSQAKDDIKPRQIFELQKRGAKHRAIIAKYCLQDCALGNRLINKLDVLSNNIGMANVCSVPLSYLFLRGQGIKGTSLVAKKCSDENYLIPVLPKPKVVLDADGNPIEEAGVGYEGATVLDPKPGVYFTPTVILDYNSLYPNSERHKNMSHETIVEDEKYANLPDHYYHRTWINNNDGTVQCVKFAQAFGGEKGTVPESGIIPNILESLLDARASTKKLMKDEKDEFRKKVLDGLQNAFKVTANSLYGLIGARTSVIYYREIAAATTATGRDMLHLAIKIVALIYPDAVVIYGDTDSIFIQFRIVDDKGRPLEGREALVKAMEYGKHMADEINKRIHAPQKIVFEKILCPFAILSKKRYLGRKYEDSVDEFKDVSMGIVLKRRDNALIVKDVFGGVIRKIMQLRSKEKAIRFIKRKLIEILNDKVPIARFIIAKTIRSQYKKPEQIAHYQLALRMAERDPGNAPRSNDRIPYVFVRIDKNGVEKKDVIQSERVEHPDWVKEHGLKLDYMYYIRKQIMVPVCQFLSLIMRNPELIFERCIEKEMHRRRGAKVSNIKKWLPKAASSDAEDDSPVSYDFKPKDTSQKWCKDAVKGDVTDFFKAAKEGKGDEDVEIDVDFAPKSASKHCTLEGSISKKKKGTSKKIKY